MSSSFKDSSSPKKGKLASLAIFVLERCPLDGTVLLLAMLASNSLGNKQDCMLHTMLSCLATYLVLPKFPRHCPVAV